MTNFESIPENTFSASEEIRKGLKARFESVTISEPEKVYLIPPIIHGYIEEMASRGNQHDGISQHLRALIKDAGNYYAVVDVMSVVKNSADKSTEVYEDVVITRHIPNNNAVPLGVVGDEGIVEIQDDPIKGLASQVPDRRFSIVKTVDGSIGIVNHGKTKNLELFFPKRVSKKNELENLLYADTVNAAAETAFWSFPQVDPKSLS